MDNVYYRKKDSPCKGCTERQVGCHGSCEKYLDWSKKEAKTHNVILKEKANEYVKNEMEIKGRLKRKVEFYRNRKDEGRIKK